MLMIKFYHTSGPDQNPRFISHGAVQKCVRANRPSYQNVSFAFRHHEFVEGRGPVGALDSGI